MGAAEKNNRPKGQKRRGWGWRTDLETDYRGRDVAILSNSKGEEGGGGRIWASAWGKPSAYSGVVSERQKRGSIKKERSGEEVKPRGDGKGNQGISLGYRNWKGDATRGEEESILGSV